MSAVVTAEQSGEPEPVDPAARRRAGAGLPGSLAETLTAYRAALAAADLSDNARRGYGSRVAGFLDWLDTGPDLGADGDPLTQPVARDYAARDYRSWLKTVRRATPWTVNAHLTALDHFYAHHLGLGAPVVKRERITATAPESLEPDEQRRFIRACGRCGSVRNAAIGLLILYTGLRVEEVEALDIDDIQMSARRGKVIVRDGKGGVYREIPLHHAARVAPRAWLDVRSEHRGADDTRALFLSRRGERMRVRAIRYVVAELGLAARLIHEAGHPDAGKSRVHPHTLRHTFGTQLQMSRIATDASFGSLCECPLPAPQRVRPSAEVGAWSGTNHRDLRCHHSGCTKRHDEAPNTVVQGDDMMHREQQRQALTRAGAATARSAS